jgi:MerR family transcriptional regulator, copper efflux regulator
MPQLKIGQVAALAGVAVDTIRYYERLGLLPQAPRRSSGYRVFDESTVEQIKLVKQLQDLGLSLEDIDGMLTAVSAANSECRHESARIQAALERTEAKMLALTVIQEKLRQALQRCARGECEIVEQVKHVSRVRAGTGERAGAVSGRPAQSAAPRSRRLLDGSGRARRRA